MMMGSMFDDARRAFCAEAEDRAASLEHGTCLSRSELQRFVHQLRGSAGLFGAHRTAFIAAELETAIRAHTIANSEVDDLIDELVLQMRADCRTLQTKPS